MFWYVPHYPYIHVHVYFIYSVLCVHGCWCLESEICCQIFEWFNCNDLFKYIFLTIVAVSIGMLLSIVCFSVLWQGPSVSAYVTYVKTEDASKAIHAVNNAFIDGRYLKWIDWLLHVHVHVHTDVAVHVHVYCILYYLYFLFSRASYGTTKYCSFFLRGIQCTKPVSFIHVNVYMLCTSTFYCVHVVSFTFFSLFHRIACISMNLVSQMLALLKKTCNLG